MCACLLTFVVKSLSSVYLLCVFCSYLADTGQTLPGFSGIEQILYSIHRRVTAPPQLKGHSMAVSVGGGVFPGGGGVSRSEGVGVPARIPLVSSPVLPAQMKIGAGRDSSRVLDYDKKLDYEKKLRPARVSESSLAPEGGRDPR